MSSYCVCSDIHCGHLRVPTKHIIQSFISSILTEDNKDLDVIFIAGDLFDRVLDFYSSEVTDIIFFFHYLLEYCYNNDISLRVLEGTNSHDNRQSAKLVDINNIRSNPCDLKYFKVLDIEYIERLKKYVLYIPDEWCHDHDYLEQQIQTKLNQLNIHQVDIAILHGQFNYQLVSLKQKGFYFKEEYFLPLVKDYIHIGHYHTFSTFDRIIAQGSLDRLTHGQEEDKGYVIVEDGQWKFVINKNAYIFQTLSITNKTTIQQLDKKIKQYPVQSYIRLLVSNEHPFSINFKDLKLRYLDYNLSKITKEHISELNKNTYIDTENGIDMDEVLSIDTNIYQLLMNNILQKNTLTLTEQQKLEFYAERFKLTEHQEVVNE